MARLIVIFIAMVISILEVYVIAGGFMTIWGSLIANSMFSGYYVTSMLIKDRVRVTDVKQITNYNEAMKHWIASSLVMAAPTLIGMAIILLMASLIAGFPTLFMMIFVLCLSVYAMVTLAIGNWSNIEID